MASVRDTLPGSETGAYVHGVANSQRIFSPITECMQGTSAEIARRSEHKKIRAGLEEWKAVTERFPNL